LVSKPSSCGDHRPSRKRLLIAVGLATVAFDLAVLLLDKRLEATGGPSILGLEFAGSEHQVGRIMSEWGEHGLHLARLSLWLDFGFMLSYGTFFSLAAFATRDLARERGLRLLVRAGAVTPLLAPAAALFDAAENITWLLLLGGHGSALAARFGTMCAVAKFVLIALAILYAICGLIAWLRFRIQRKQA
jgi:hypothetical protein